MIYCANCGTNYYGYHQCNGGVRYASAGTEPVFSERDLINRILFRLDQIENQLGRIETQIQAGSESEK